VDRCGVLLYRDCTFFHAWETTLLSTHINRPNPSISPKHKTQTTTIGYEDLTPQREFTRLFAVAFIPLSVGAMGHVCGSVASWIVAQRAQVYDKRLWRHELTPEDLTLMSGDHSGTVTELDCLVFMLHAMKKVEPELIEEIRKHFVRLDQTKSGTLVRGDLEMMARKKLRSARAKLRLSEYKEVVKGAFFLTWKKQRNLFTK
jgi:hypothetical protein